MYHIMAVMTDQLQVLMVQCDIRIIHVAWIQMDLVMNDQSDVLMTDLAHPSINTTPICDIRAPASFP